MQNNILPAVRAWWSTTSADAMLARRGLGVKLMPHDIAALAVHAVQWQDHRGAANSDEDVRRALVLRFGPAISRLENRGFLRIWQSVAQYNLVALGTRQIAGCQGAWDGATAHLFAKEIPRGNEAAVFLHEAGEHGSMWRMLGQANYDRLVSRARELMFSDNPLALEAVGRIPDGTPAAHLNSELVAYLVEVACSRKPARGQTRPHYGPMFDFWLFAASATIAAMTFSDYEIWILAKAGVLVFAACVYGGVKGWRRGRSQRGRRGS